MNVVYVASVGTADPTTASLPLHLAANGSVEVGDSPSIILAGHGAELVVGDNLQTMEGIGVPPARDLVAKLKEHQAPIYV